MFQILDRLFFFKFKIEKIYICTRGSLYYRMYVNTVCGLLNAVELPDAVVVLIIVFMYYANVASTRIKMHM